MTLWTPEYLFCSAIWALIYFVIFQTVREGHFCKGSFLRVMGIDRFGGSDIANKTVSSFFAVGSALVGIRYLFYSAARWSLWIQSWAAGYFLYDTVAMFLVQKENGITLRSFLNKNPLILCHHLILAFCFIPFLARGIPHPAENVLVGAAFLMEASTPFVCFRAVLAIIGKRDSFLYIINGLLMVFVFFLCRIAVYPIVYWILMPTIGGNNIFESYWIFTPPRCRFYVLLTLLPQVYWMGLMIRGAVKMAHDYSNYRANKNR